MSGACTVTTVRPLPSTCRLEPRSADRHRLTVELDDRVDRLAALGRHHEVHLLGVHADAGSSPPAASAVTASSSAVHLPPSAPRRLAGSESDLPPATELRRRDRAGGGTG